MVISTTRYRLKLFLLSLVMLVVAMSFNAGLNGASFKKVYTELLTGRVHVIGLDVQVRLERALHLGKLLDKFVGLETLLDSISRKQENINEIYVVNPDGDLIVSSSTARRETSYQGVASFFNEKNGGQPAVTRHYQVLTDARDRHLLFALHDRQGRLVGILGVCFARSAIDQKIRQMIVAEATLLSRIALVCISLIGIALMLLPVTRSGPGKRGDQRIDRRLYFFILLVVTGGQVFFSVHSAGLFRSENQRAALQQVTTQSLLIKQELESKVLSRGIAVERLRGIEKRFASTISANPTIGIMQLLNPEGTILNMADAGGPLSAERVAVQKAIPVTATDTAAVLPLYGKMGPGHVVGYLRATLSEKSIAKQVKEIYLDSITVIVLSILFLFEMKFFLEFFLTGVDGSRKGARAMQPWRFARPAAFLLLFGWALPISFIPLKMQLLYQPFWGLSKDLVLGLPISMEMGCALISALLAGNLTDRYGWHLPFFAGIGLCSLGCLLAGLAETAVGFIGYRGLVGFGYGLSWMAIQGFVFYNTSVENRALGYSTLVAGIFSGHICGTAVGAMLAERFGYDLVFFCAALLLPLSALFVLFFMRATTKNPPQAAQLEKLRWSEMVALLTDRSFVSIMLLSVVPFSLCQVGLLYYAVPLYLKQLEVSQSSIGRVLMVYGLSVIFIAPLLSRLVDRSRRKALFIALGGGVGSLGMISLFFVPGTAAVLLAVFALGVSSSLAGSAQPALVLRLKSVQRVGTGRSMAIQRAADKLGQMAGPIFLGMLVASIGIEHSVVMAGLIFLGCTLLFILLVREPAKGNDGDS